MIEPPVKLDKVVSAKTHSNNNNNIYFLYEIIK